MLKELNINGITVVEGQKYIHKKSECIWEIKQDACGELKFDSGVLQREIIEERLKKVTLSLNKNDAVESNKQCPYKIKDVEGNMFVYAYHENGYPVYRTRGGSKHIFENEFKFYIIIEQDAPKE
ncbi:hypothetical protein [Clostridium estertheticum]|uniref:hypothetical protein n=1 Tax=Clostridium estertheticum TaxID=238834 RepID=UPI001C0BF2E3|nr:hypothetical protein [Clostridium estertheticum]MBU3173312.1 hypothetical protein [Clostridium estertheticum]